MITVNYYITSIISILCLFVNLLHLRELDLIKKSVIRRFRCLAYFIIFEIIIDTLFKAFEGIPNIATELLYVLKMLEFTMNPILPFLILLIFNNNHSPKVIKYIQIIQVSIIIINAILQLVSIFEHFTFLIDQNNIYHRTSYTIIYVFCLLTSTGLMIFAIYFFSRNVQNVNILTLSGLCLMILTGLILRTVCPNTNFDWLCISISFFIIDIYYVNLSLRLDPLTQLLNRQVYNTMIEKINYTTLVIMIDANNFKSINDTYGHECGDKTLRGIAKCIFRAYSDFAWCFRIGGDEFCAILKPKAFQTLIDKTPRSDAFLMAENLTKRLDEQIQLYEKKDNQYCLQYGVSQGYAIYYSQADHQSIRNNMPFDKVLRLADIRMYHKKKEFKKDFENGKYQVNSDDTDMQYPERVKVIYKSSNPELIENSD